MVGGAVDRDRGGAKADDGAGELLPRGMQQGDVEQTGVATDGPRGGLLDEHDGVFCPRAHRGGGIVAAVQAQTERVAVEGDRAIEIGHGQVDWTEAECGGQRGAWGGVVGGRRRHRLRR